MPVGRGHLHDQINQECRFSGTRGPENQGMAIFLPIGRIERIEQEGLGTAIEEQQAWVSGAARSTIGWKHGRQMRAEHEA